MDSVNTLLSGATFVLTAANLGVSVDSNIRIRDIQNKINEISNHMLGITKSLSTIDNRLQLIHIKTEEMHLREAISNAIKHASGADGSIDLQLYKHLHGDFENFEDAIGGQFKSIKLSSDVRQNLESLFNFLLGLRMAVLEKHNSNLLNPTKVIRGIDINQFLPCDKSLLIFEAIQLSNRAVELESFEKKSAEFIEEAFSFAGEKDHEALSNLFTEYKEKVYSSTNPFSLEFASLLYELGLFEKHDDFESLYNEAEAILALWLASDRGLVFRVTCELEALNLGYSNLYSDLEIEENETIDVQFNSSIWKAA